MKPNGTLKSLALYFTMAANKSFEFGALSWSDYFDNAHDIELIERDVTLRCYSSHVADVALEQACTAHANLLSSGCALQTSMEPENSFNSSPMVSIASILSDSVRKLDITHTLPAYSTLKPIFVFFHGAGLSALSFGVCRIF